jgi:hypothetical protein
MEHPKPKQVIKYTGTGKEILGFMPDYREVYFEKPLKDGMYQVIYKGMRCHVKAKDCSWKH